MSHPLNRPGAVTWADPERQARCMQWLARLAPVHGLRPETLRLASADASFRRYLRVDGQHSFIVMDAPPDKEDCAPFVQVQGLMQQAGLNVPQVFDWDRAHGFLLLSDLGQHTVIERLDPADPQAAAAWYRQAADTLLQWQLASRPGVLPPYSDALLRRELALFPDWYVAQHRQVVLSAAQQQVLAQAFDRIVAENLSAPSVFVHRDFMMRNLMAPTLPAARGSLPPEGAQSALGRPGGGLMAPQYPGGPLGVLDFQDAVFGPITYDIASLLRDAFISWDEEFVLDITVRYWEQARKAGLLGSASASGWGDDFGAFYRSVEWMGLQRHLKVAGIFARLTLRDGKPRYLQDAPRFIAYIRATARRYRELGPLARLVDQIEGDAAPVGFAYGRM
ncbi:MAG: phosphotransferase [Burkholderiaceae bacterium]|nr:phosphotransferase [Burkholderiaceae bacterium]